MNNTSKASKVSPIISSINPAYNYKLKKYFYIKKLYIIYNI